MQNNLFNWSEHTWALLDQIGIMLGLLLPIMSLLAAAWAFLKKEQIKHWFSRNQFPHIGQSTDASSRWDGLVFTLSQTETPKWVIKTRSPRYIALLASEQSAENAAQVEQYARQQGVAVITKVLLADPDDLQEIRQEVKHLIMRLQQKGCENIAVDITGGKTTMSLGAFMAAEEAQLPSLYVSSQYDKTLKQVDMRSATLINVSGNS